MAKGLILRGHDQGLRRTMMFDQQPTLELLFEQLGLDAECRSN